MSRGEAGVLTFERREEMADCSGVAGVLPVVIEACKNGELVDPPTCPRVDPAAKQRGRSLMAARDGDVQGALANGVWKVSVRTPSQQRSDSRLVAMPSGLVEHRVSLGRIGLSL